MTTQQDNAVTFNDVHKEKKSIIHQQKIKPTVGEITKKKKKQKHTTYK